MKIIIKHSTVGRVTRLIKNMDSLLDSLMGSDRVSSQHYADPVEAFQSVRKNKVFKTVAKAARLSNDPESKEMTVHINPAFIEDVLDAAETCTTTVYTVVIPAFKVYNDRLGFIQRKYKLK